MGQLKVARIKITGSQVASQMQVMRIFGTGLISTAKPALQVARMQIIGSGNIANAGPNLNDLEPGTVQALDGKASLGSTYAWALESATNGETVTITNPTSKSTASYTTPQTVAGTTLVFKLTVDGSVVARVSHTILPHIDWVKKAGVWHPASA